MTDYRSRLAQVRKNEAEHEARMKKLAKAGGISLKKLRELPQLEREEFIFKHRRAYYEE